MSVDGLSKLDLQFCISGMKRTKHYRLALAEYNLLLSILGNVEGDDIVALALVAGYNTIDEAQMGK